MAKIVGLVGAVSGKVGNFVGAVVGGVQTMRVYQPIVANPRTAGQVQQRGKVNLSGQLSSAITRVAIEGLRGNARERRSALLKNLIEAVTVSNNVYSLLGEKIVLSKGGFDATISGVFSKAQRSQDNTIGVYVQLTKYSAVGADTPDVVRIVSLAVPKPIVNGTAKAACAVYDVSMDEANVLFEDEMAVIGDPLNYNVFIYAIPMRMVNRGALNFDYLNSLQETGVIKIDGSLKTSGAYSFGDSLYLGVKSVSDPT